jgi:hypothetical protein
MRVGYYVESPADRAALTVLTEGLLGAPPEPINLDLEAHSVPGFFSARDGVLRGVHYHSDAEGLIVVVDSDDTDVHSPADDGPKGCGDRCRLCHARKIIDRAQEQLTSRPGRERLKVAIGLAVPAIEAWYLVGKEHQVGEAAWQTGRAANRPPFTRAQFKKLA